MFSERAEGKQVVESQLDSALGEGKGDAALDRIVCAHAVGAHDGILSIGLDRCADKVGIAEIAVPWVDGNAESLGVAGEHALLTIGQISRVLGHVLCRNGEQRLFIGVGVHGVLAHMGRVLNTGGRAQPFAGVLRHTAGGARLFCAYAGQRLTQLFNLFRASFGCSSTGHYGGGCQGDQCTVAYCCLHYASFSICL